MSCDAQTGAVIACSVLGTQALNIAAAWLALWLAMGGRLRISIGRRRTQTPDE